jgi:coenzyme F420-reducing hydrogenase delta subunit
MRLKYPGSIRIVSVPCTGKVDLIHIMRAFEKGADGVYVLGCMEGECRYESGNLRARKRVDKARDLLERIGIGGERVAMYNLSSSEAPRFVEYAREMTERIRSLGPNPIKLASKQHKAA